MKNGDVYVLSGSKSILLGVDDYYEINRLKSGQCVLSRMTASRDTQMEIIRSKGYYFACSIAEILGDVEDQLIKQAGYQV